MKLISIVVPMYNESMVVSLFFERINEVIGQLPNYKFEIVAVNDGSTDDTLEQLKKQQLKQKNLVVVALARNFGHEPAVAAGLKVSQGDAVIPMDADLQDPPEVIIQLLEKFEEGYEVVNARRSSRSEDSWSKRTSAKYFYKFIGKLSGKVKIPNDVGHFRLISRRVCDTVNELTEKNRVFRIEVPYVGFKTTEVLFKRPKRAGGVSHYNFKSMFKLAFDAITSTSSAPLHWLLRITIALDVLFFGSVIAQIVLFVLEKAAIINLISNTGHLSWLFFNIIFLILLFIMYFLSIIAIYVARIFIETQNRPFFVIDEILKKDD
jgi:polyisoprenyl-phosphate glycosyltransferase